VIDECIRMVREENQFKERVLDEYQRVAISIEADKGAVMRALSKVFPREQMKKVHAAIINAN